MTDVINVETVDRLRRLYKHVDDVDLFTGGLSERFVYNFLKWVYLFTITGGPYIVSENFPHTKYARTKCSSIPCNCLFTFYRPVTGGVVGPTFACIVGQQFLNLRKGDRFWYENGNHPGGFNQRQLQEIRKSSLSRIICDNLDDIGRYLVLMYTLSEK